MGTVNEYKSGLCMHNVRGLARGEGRMSGPELIFPVRSSLFRVLNLKNVMWFVAKISISLL